MKYHTQLGVPIADVNCHDKSIKSKLTVAVMAWADSSHWLACSA